MYTNIYFQYLFWLNLHIALIKKNIVILGAGITGLSTAHYLSLKNKDFLVLEKSNRIGGNIFSEIVSLNIVGVDESFGHLKVSL